MKSFYFIVGVDTISTKTREKHVKETTCTVHATNSESATQKMIQKINETQKNIYIKKSWELKDCHEENYLGLYRL